MAITEKKPDVIAEHLRGLSGYNERGEEIPDSRPVELPVGFVRPRSLQETMAHLLRNEEFRRALDKHEVDTFEEADDFDVGDDDDPLAKTTPYEQDFDPNGAIAREQEIRGGFVEEIPLEKKQKAAKIAAEVKTAAERKEKFERDYHAYKRSKVKEHLRSRGKAKPDTETNVDDDDDED